MKYRSETTQAASDSGPEVTVQDSKDISLTLTLIMAVSCGASVASIYYNQPLLVEIGRSFPEQKSLIGMIPTATQVGYAIGLLFLVPLGDQVERRFMILLQLIALAIAFVGVAIAPTAWYLFASSLILGIAASVAQQILPFAADLAAPHRRGATIGIVMSGLLCGILLSRVLAGFIAVHLGWRAAFWFGLISVLAIAVLLRVSLPKSEPKSKLSYGRLIGSMTYLWRTEPGLRTATTIQAFMFASFSVFWTILALQLDIRFGLGADKAGMFGVIGAIGVLFAPFAGKVADRRGPHFIIGISTLLMAVSWMIFDFWQSITVMIIGVILLDFAAQGSQVSNQHVIQSIQPSARNRLNAIMMSGMFLGGGIGSACASLVWKFFGWGSICLLGALLAGGALVAFAHGQQMNNRGSFQS